MKKVFIFLVLIRFTHGSKGQVTYDLADILTKRPNIGENLVWHYFNKEEGHLASVVNGNLELSSQLKTIAVVPGRLDVTG